MKSEEAALILSYVLANIKSGPEDEGTAISTEVIDMAVQALLKEVPQSISERRGMYVICPHCKQEVLPFAHCTECGQMIAP